MKLYLNSSAFSLRQNIPNFSDKIESKITISDLYGKNKDIENLRKDAQNIRLDYDNALNKLKNKYEQ